MQLNELTSIKYYIENDESQEEESTPAPQKYSPFPPIPESSGLNKINKIVSSKGEVVPPTQITNDYKINKKKCILKQRAET